MPNLKSARLLGAAALLSVSALAAAAQQTPAPEPSPPAEKPPMVKPVPAPETAPQNRPAPSSSQAKPAHPLMGLNAISSDGSKIGDVRAVKTSPDGRIMALHIRSGGFLGFGGRIVEIPEGKFMQVGNTIKLNLTAEEVSKLPEVKDAS